MEIEHYYTLNPDWYVNLASKTGSELKKNNEKCMLLSEKLGSGNFFFTEVVSGISALSMDTLLNSPIKIKRTAGKDDLYILHFDFSEGVNAIEVNNVRSEIGFQVNLGLTILDSNVTSYFEPTVGENLFGLVLLIEKKKLHKMMKIDENADVIHPKMRKNGSLHFYDCIDRHSLILINELKKKTVFDESYNLFIKGVALNLVANFLKRYTSSTPMTHRIKQYEVDLVNKTMLYLKNNLYSSFPGVKFLAEMAGMSVSKYKILFRELQLDTPNGFFVKEKVILGNKLLTSENFTTIKQVLDELNYSKHSHFNTNYFKIFNRMPSDDFMRK